MIQGNHCWIVADKDPAVPYCGATEAEAGNDAWTVPPNHENAFAMIWSNEDVCPNPDNPEEVQLQPLTGLHPHPLKPEKTLRPNGRGLDEILETYPG